jgi:hypothetical protein
MLHVNLHVHVDHNSISNAGAAAIAEALQHNKQLQKLCLGDNFTLET